MISVKAAYILQKSSSDTLLRLRRAVHLRNSEDLAALLPPNHLEHEGELLQGRSRRAGARVPDCVASSC